MPAVKQLLLWIISGSGLLLIVLSQIITVIKMTGDKEVDKTDMLFSRLYYSIKYKKPRVLLISGLILLLSVMITLLIDLIRS